MPTKSHARRGLELGCVGTRGMHVRTRQARVLPPVFSSERLRLMKGFVRLLTTKFFILWPKSASGSMAQLSWTFGSSAASTCLRVCCTSTLQRARASWSVPPTEVVEFLRCFMDTLQEDSAPAASATANAAASASSSGGPEAAAEDSSERASSSQCFSWKQCRDARLTSLDHRPGSSGASGAVCPWSRAISACRERISRSCSAARRSSRSWKCSDASAII
mmetsp:Transcript_93815/g.280007  ORF Transcript_93815/g.280007 Transcript_93815/m.280007 type:complete len:220 (+) Transcript_93815:1680-2339(+)